MLNQKQTSNKKEVMRYAGLGTQIFVSLGLAAFLGYKIDQWLNTSLPLLAGILPLIVLCVILYKLFKETSKRKTDENKEG